MPAGLDVLKVSANSVNSIGRTTVEKIHWQMFTNCSQTTVVSPVPLPHKLVTSHKKQEVEEDRKKFNTVVNPSHFPC